MQRGHCNNHLHSVKHKQIQQPEGLKITLAYVELSANWDKMTWGFFKSILAIPTSPRASPLPSTTATITDAVL